MTQYVRKISCLVLIALGFSAGTPQATKAMIPALIVVGAVGIPGAVCGIIAENAGPAMVYPDSYDKEEYCKALSVIADAYGHLKKEISIMVNGTESRDYPTAMQTYLNTVLKEMSFLRENSLKHKTFGEVYWHFRKTYFEEESNAFLKYFNAIICFISDTTDSEIKAFLKENGASEADLAEILKLKVSPKAAEASASIGFAAMYRPVSQPIELVPGAIFQIGEIHKKLLKNKVSDTQTERDLILNDFKTQATKQLLTAEQDLEFIRQKQPKHFTRMNFAYILEPLQRLRLTNPESFDRVYQDIKSMYWRHSPNQIGKLIFGSICFSLDPLDGEIRLWFRNTFLLNIFEIRTIVKYLDGSEISEDDIKVVRRVVELALGDQK